MLLTQLLPEVDALFAAVFQSVGIVAKWTQHSWILPHYLCHPETSWESLQE